MSLSLVSETMVQQTAHISLRKSSCLCPRFPFRIHRIQLCLLRRILEGKKKTAKRLANEVEHPHGFSLCNPPKLYFMPRY